MIRPEARARLGGQADGEYDRERRDQEDRHDDRAHEDQAHRAAGGREPGTLACRVIAGDGSTALASRYTLTPPYSAALGPIPIVPPPSAARMATCKPALAAAMPATIGRLAP